jgi:hypothetical protein
VGLEQSAPNNCDRTGFIRQTLYAARSQTVPAKFSESKIVQTGQTIGSLVMKVALPRENNQISARSWLHPKNQDSSSTTKTMRKLTNSVAYRFNDKLSSVSNWKLSNVTTASVLTFVRNIKLGL